MRIRFIALAVLGVVSLGTPNPLHAQFAVSETVRVPMPDGVTLETDIWRPVLDNSPRPVLLRRTPYGRAIDFAVAQNIISAGYNLVSQDVRGRGQSGGVFEPFFDDKIDGKATIDWIATQPWSNDRVGSYSGSAEGIVQYMAMASAPEALRCAHLTVPTHALYEGIFPGGAWRTELGTKWLTDLGASPVIDLWKSHEARDAYWDDATLSIAEMAGIDHPVFIVGGMFDIFAPSQVRALRELQANVAVASRGDVFLVLGPWTHGGYLGRNQGQLLYPEDAPYAAYVTDLLAYMDWCLKGAARPTFAPVRYYLTELTDELVPDPANNAQQLIAARGEWREASTWPPPASRAYPFYVRADDRLRGEPEPTGAPVPISVNPASAVPSLGGGNLSTAAGPFDQKTIDERDDVLVFQTEAASEVVEIVGSPRAELWVSSATSDLDVVVRVEALTPKGHAVALADGILRGRFAGGFDKLRPLVPNEATRFVIEVGPLAVRLPVGHALRIAISGSSAPRYEPNPNVGQPLSMKPAAEATTLTLYRDDAHRSRVILPVHSGALPGMGKPEDEAAADAGTEPESGDLPLEADGGASTAVDGSSDVPDTSGMSPKESVEGCGCELMPPPRRSLAAWLSLALALAFALRRRARMGCA